MGFPGGANGKEPAYQSGDTRDMGQSLGQDDFLEEGIATHSSIIAWRILWTEELGGLQAIGLQKSLTRQVT